MNSDNEDPHIRTREQENRINILLESKFPRTNRSRPGFKTNVSFRRKIPKEEKLKQFQMRDSARSCIAKDEKKQSLLDQKKLF